MSKETFDADWLTLREPADHRARSVALADRLAAWWGSTAAASVLDLGSGTGSNLRWLAPRLSGSQSWTLVDHDTGLLERVEPPEDARPTIRTSVCDLATETPALVGTADLVTASALLDLVSEAWIEALADACAESGSAAYFALTYDGTTRWEPEGSDPVDDLVLEVVNAHQRGDKGIGPALGPTATRAAEAAFRARGFRTEVAPSPWRLGRDEAALARELVRGWARVGAEAHPDRAEDIAAWSQRRRVDVALGDVEIVVGHLDLLALPPERRGR